MTSLGSIRAKRRTPAFRAVEPWSSTRSFQIAIALRPCRRASVSSSRYGSHALALGARPGPRTAANRWTPPRKLPFPVSTEPRELDEKSLAMRNEDPAECPPVSNRQICETPAVFSAQHLRSGIIRNLESPGFRALWDGISYARLQRMRTERELNRIASEIIGAAVVVHRKVGPGCFESAYLPCLAYELQRQGLGFETKVAIAINYETLTVPRAYEVDLLVERNVVVELKATSASTPVDARQLLTYLIFTGCPLGLLLNFGAVRLTDGIKRVVNNFPDGTSPP
jgi:GxxExxY protein